MIDELFEVVKFMVGFLPWILFLFLPIDGLESLKRGVLICSVACVVSGWNSLRKGFILQWASLVFFLFCAVSLYLLKWIWVAEYMGIIANGFLVAVIWFTILIGQPFTLQYARADLAKERWNDANLIRGCRFIALFWAILLLLPAVASVFRFVRPSALPDGFYFYLSVFSMIGGVAFTTLYKRAKRKQREATGTVAARVVNGGPLSTGKR